MKDKDKNHPSRATCPARGVDGAGWSGIIPSPTPDRRQPGPLPLVEQPRGRKEAMGMARKKPSPFVVGPDNDLLFVDVKQSGIGMLCVVTDQLRIYRFADDSRAFLSVADAVAWHEKEAAANDGSCPEFGQMATYLRTILEKFQRGEMKQQA